MSRIFLSHSSLDSREALALKRWLVEQEPPLATDIFLDIDPDVGLRPGERWKDRLQQASAKCEAVVCLLSSNWEASHECKTEYRVAENLNKQILCARLEPSAGDELTSEWQRCDLFGESDMTSVDLDDGPPVMFATKGLYRLRDAIRGTGISAHSFVWPPPDDVVRAPYRGWEPFEQVDAAVFFGRDAAIVHGLDELRGMRVAETKSMFVVLGPSGTGKSSFLRAGLMPRVAREDRRFTLLGVVRPGRNALTGDAGLAAAIWHARDRLGLSAPSLGEIKTACHGDVERVRELLIEIQQTATDRLPDPVSGDDKPAPPTLILPLDQAEELFSADAGAQAVELMSLIRRLTVRTELQPLSLIVVATIRTDRFEVMQTHAELAGVESRVFDDLKPMPRTQFKEVITGPAARASEGGRPLTVSPDLVERLLVDAAEGADTLPMLSLTLARLYADYGSTGELRVEQYEAMGGMRRVVETEINEILAADPDRRRHQLDCLRAAFIPWLATVNPENDHPLRRMARYDDLPEESRPLIDALVAKRLLVKDQRDGQVVVEVALESLLRQWDELSEWLREQRHELQVADDVERADTAWKSNNRDAAWLLAGSRLADAERVVSSPTFTQRMNPVREYIDASRQSENDRLAAEEERRHAELRNAQERQAVAEAHASDLRKRSRILRAVVAITAAVAVVAVVGLVYAVSARGQAQDRFRQATSVRLASDSDNMLNGSRPGSDERALLELLAANALSPNTFGQNMYSVGVKTFNTLKLIDPSMGVFGAIFSPDGRRFVVGGDNGALRLYDAQTGLQLGADLVGHTKWIDGATFSPDGHKIASVSDDLTVRLWNADTGRPIGQPMLGHQDQVWAISFSPDGHMLASGSVDRTMRLWNVDTGRPIGQPLRHPDRVISVEFSPDGRHIASGDADGMLRLWDVTTGQQSGPPLKGHTGEVIDVAFSPDGRRIASASGDGDVRLWDAQTGLPIGEPLPAHGSRVLSVAFSPDGHRLASGSGDGAVRLWDADTRQLLGAPMLGQKGGVWTLSFSPDGTRLLSGSQDGTIRLWDVGIRRPLIGHIGGVASVAVSPDGHRIASAGDDGTVRLWDADSGRPIGKPLVDSDKPLSGVAFSPDGQRLAIASADGTVRMWNADTGTLVGDPIDPGQGPLTSVAFSPDGRRLAIGGGDTSVGVSSDHDGTVRLWDVKTFRPVGEPRRHGERVNSVAFSPDGNRIVSGGNEGDNTGSVRLWDANTGELVAATTIGEAQRIVWAVAFSPDGRQVAAAGVDGFIEVLDADGLDIIGQPMKGHEDRVVSLAYSPDGRALASASRDETIRLWDVESGQQVGAALTAHTDDVDSVAFSPDGQRIVSGSTDGTVRVWPAVAGSKELCDKLTENMSHKQWNEWVSPDIDYIKVCPDLRIPPD
ncbi:TIR domain-containing protein [Mycobacterium sp. ITM-2016-00318]|uniref:nSTAND1 domain-containing NTPase n=1 Tax=Mycobacterium sp. ITM-2016-00318 TaxID=2099693 RepID=UPI000CF99F37|nr:TIR domain-containing protein [Mycobacterium sp. ITM-2016-00318]WNG94321.1 TIR domain-containing protein [Mycobacterium sp. ITM-2016-00318]